MIRRAALATLILVLGSAEPSWAEHKVPGAEHFQILGVRIGEDSYESLQNKFGEVAKCHSQAHIAIAGYKNSKEELVFEFSEVGGGDITGFYLRPRVESLHEGCPLSLLPGGLSEITTGGGVRLGMTGKEFVRAFGAPKSRIAGGHWKYHWEWQKDLTDEERRAFDHARPGAVVPISADVSVWAEASFAGNRLIYFHISRLETL
jgi:hypothetical protein